MNASAISLENYVNRSNVYQMSVYRGKNQDGKPDYIAAQAGLHEPLKKTGVNSIDSLVDILKDFQGDMKKYYDSSFYQEFVTACNQLGYGSITKLNTIEVNKMMRDAAAYINTESKVIGVSDKRSKNYKDIADQMGVDKLLAIYMVLSHEHIHGKAQSKNVFEKGKLYTEIDCEARMYSALVQMSENNPSKAKEYLKLAEGVRKRYNALDKSFSQKNNKSSGLLEQYISRLEPKYKKAA